MAEVFPYEVYGLRSGAMPARAFALISPVRAILMLSGEGARTLGHELADVLREIDCEPAGLADIFLLQPPRDSPVAVSDFAHGAIQAVHRPRDLLAGVRAVTAPDGRLTLEVLTRRGWLTLPPADAATAHRIERLD